MPDCARVARSASAVQQALNSLQRLRWFVAVNIAVSLSPGSPHGVATCWVGGAVDMRFCLHTSRNSLQVRIHSVGIYLSPNALESWCCRSVADRS